MRDVRAKEIENIVHLFYSCSKVRSRWEEIKTLLRNTNTLNKPQGTLFEFIQTAIMLSERNPGPLVLITEICEALWKERNALGSTRVSSCDCPVG